MMKRPVKKEQFWQRAHHASLVHDVLYQYLNSIPIPKSDVDNLFHEMLIESGFSGIMAKIYHLAVRSIWVRVMWVKMTLRAILKRYVTPASLRV
jgi:hypothetical protein